jgi:hypothetical protein
VVPASEAARPPRGPGRTGSPGPPAGDPRRRVGRASDHSEAEPGNPLIGLRLRALIDDTFRPENQIDLLEEFDPPALICSPVPAPRPPPARSAGGNTHTRAEYRTARAGSLWVRHGVAREPARAPGRRWCSG